MDPTLAQPCIKVSRDTYLFYILDNYGLGGHLADEKPNLSVKASRESTES